MKATQLGNRFFLLTALGYVVALLSCAAVVWAISVPFLRAAQAEHLQDVARQQASAAAFLIDDVYDRAEYIARMPSVLDLVLGRTDSVAEVSDRIGNFDTGEMQHAKVLDYEGLTLYQTVPRDSAARLFADVEFREGFSALGRVAGSAERTGRIRLRHSSETGHTHVLVAVPILVNGVMEGALALEKHLAMESALPGGSRLVTDFQRSLEADDPHLVIAPVPGSPLFVRLGEGATAVSQAGSRTRELVMWISVGLSTVLLVPFLIMSFFGKRHLVAPTEALAKSRERLALQQDQLRQQSEELRELATVAELSQDAIIVTDGTGHVLWVNAAFTDLTGFTQKEAVGRTPGSLLHSPQTDPGTIQRMRAAIRAGRPIREEIMNVDRCGREYWITLSITPITGEDGTVVRFAGISSDITERRAVQEALAKAQRETEHRANHDTLTGLPNRRFLDHVLETDVGQSSVPRTIVRIDLDYFKNVNDTHGHAAGDHVLRVVSDTLRQHCREGDFVARVGGDEFVVLLSPGTTTAEADDLCEVFRLEIRKDIIFDGKACRVGASFGVASALDGIVGNDELLLSADSALYLSKSKGRNSTTLYTPEVHVDTLSKRRSAREIERAIELRQFEPYFQPQIDARTRRLAGLEALVRWNHPEHGMLAPDAFLPLAEKLSVLPEIDDIVYARGLDAVRQLNESGHKIPKVSFNVGAEQLANPRLREVHHDPNLGDTQIAFEVLESVLVEEQSSVFAFQIDLLRDLGFRIEVDDFGSGHASLVGLMQLRPDAMKLDQRLILPLTRDPSAIVTVRALVEIGRTHQIDITAEGVETEEHARLLTDLGVDTLQGFRFARPLPASKLAPFLDGLGIERTGAA